MKNSQNIVCIGAANIDKQLYLKSELVNKSSKPCIFDKAYLEV